MSTNSTQRQMFAPMRPASRAVQSRNDDHQGPHPAAEAMSPPKILRASAGTEPTNQSSLPAPPGRPLNVSGLKTSTSNAQTRSPFLAHSVVGGLAGRRSMDGRAPSYTQPQQQFPASLHMNTSVRSVGANVGATSILHAQRTPWAPQSAPNSSMNAPALASPRPSHMHSPLRSSNFLDTASFSAPAATGDSFGGDGPERAHPRIDAHTSSPRLIDDAHFPGEGDGDDDDYRGDEYPSAYGHSSGNGGASTSSDPDAHMEALALAPAKRTSGAFEDGSYMYDDAGAEREREAKRFRGVVRGDGRQAGPLRARRAPMLTSVLQTTVSSEYKVPPLPLRAHVPPSALAPAQDAGTGRIRTLDDLSGALAAYMRTHPGKEERARERWRKCTLTEWKGGADGACARTVSADMSAEGRLGRDR
jgi:hypothetical protein